VSIIVVIVIEKLSSVCSNIFERSHASQSFDILEICVNFNDDFQRQQLILGKIIIKKTAAIRCQISWLKCIKFDFGRGSAQTSLREILQRFSDRPEFREWERGERRGKAWKKKGGESKEGW